MCDLIFNLPQGHDTQRLSFAPHLSASRRQRIALARALFGSPRLMVLDGPAANLDRGVDGALDAAIDDIRVDEKAVVLGSHRSLAINKANLLLFVVDSIQRGFGPRKKVMELYQRSQTDNPNTENANRGRSN